jgi:histidyl-tRNA synthetase
MKEKVPGVGTSIGLDRLIAGLEQLGVTEKKGSYLDAEILCQNNDHAVEYQKIAALLRKNGAICNGRTTTLSVTYPEKNTKIRIPNFSAVHLSPTVMNFAIQTVSRTKVISTKARKLVWLK